MINNWPYDDPKYTENGKYRILTGGDIAQKGDQYLGSLSGIWSDMSELAFGNHIIVGRYCTFYRRPLSLDKGRKA